MGNKDSSKNIVNNENNINMISIADTYNNALNNNIMIGSNYKNLKNLKILKDETQAVSVKSPNNLKLEITNINNDSHDIKKKSIFTDKSNSITNSNMNTNPSTIYKSDSLQHSNLVIKNNLNCHEKKPLKLMYFIF